MRNGLILIAGLLLAAGQAAARCSDELAWQTAGAWSHGEDTLANDRALPRSARAAALRKSDEVVELLKRAIPDPKGVQAVLQEKLG